MSEKKLSPGHAQLLGRVAAVVLVLLAAWFGWSAWEQFRDSARRHTVERARDAGAIRGRLCREVSRDRHADDVADDDRRGGDHADPLVADVTADRRLSVDLHRSGVHEPRT